MLNKPPRLQFGETIGVVAPASPPPDPDMIDISKAVLEAMGFAVKLGKHTRKRHGFLAGKDRERAFDLMSMFADKRVRAIFCVRGGYGSTRLLPMLDYELIRANPKMLIGYSDITALHFAVLRRSQLVSFHGPMLNSDLARKGCPRFTLDGLMRTVMDPKPAGSILKGYDGRNVSLLQGGWASGRLVGGNLSMICATVGTPYQPSFRNRILFIEDVGEQPYRFDRMLTHLISAGLLEQVSAVAIGENTDCEDPRSKNSREYRQTLDDVLRERLCPLGVPVVSGLPFGHMRFNATLPLGIQATLNGFTGDLIIEESAVR